MNQTKSILVGVDFSDGARAALQQALRVATQNGAVLHLLHVIDELALDELARASQSPPAAQRADALEWGRRALLRWLEPVALPENCRTEVAVGIPLDTLLARAREWSADLIVVGAQGGNTASPQAGPLAVRVLREAPVKVLLVDSNHAQPFQTIVASVAFTPTCREVVEQARRLAALGAQRVDFLHVYDPPWHRLTHVLPALSANQDLQQQYVNMLQTQLRDYVGELRGLEASCVLQEATRHRCGISAYAQTHQADLIALGMRQPGGPRNDRADSTAERLVRELPCSVLAVKPASAAPAEVQPPIAEGSPAEAAPGALPASA
ncbi:MAG: universal stress protein [Verrucomicrobiales bacterium]|nr:universal stress protein [Verrucomicrobiales bacterium]